MPDLRPHPTGRYFEEFTTGERIVTRGRTVTETDVVAFAALTGDWNPIHSDVVFAATAPFGQRVAHGALGLSLALGLAARTGMMEGTVLAFREIEEWKFRLPVFLGDTIRAELTVEELRPMPRLGGGAVVIGADVKNQRDESVMRGRWTVLFQSKPV
ncbi:MAG TPA: MaoC/PaaZ C-terminal domain-containing protein [Anaerolineales bacterium]